MNDRQNNILKLMHDDYINTKKIAENFNVSLRTSQSDLKLILKYLDDKDIDYSFNKKLGYKINEEVNGISSNTNLRVNQILRVLLFSNKFLKLDNLKDDLYISLSTLNNDLKLVKEKLSSYDLDLISKPHHGSRIDGNEINIRRCLVQEKLMAFHDDKNNFLDITIISCISSIASSVLISNEFNISDNDFQNYILTIYLSVIRSINNCYLPKKVYETNAKTEKISKEILSKLSDYYKFEYRDEETNYVANCLIGKNSLENSQIIPLDIDEHISKILELINSKLEIDLSYSIELRVSLSLHLMPLLDRIANNNQIREIPINNIQKDFSYAFEIAIITAEYIENLTKTKLSKAEIIYLAIHYSVVLEKDGANKPKKNILFICSSRKSDSLLIKSSIYSHFSSKINQIDVKNIYEISNINYLGYDVVFSTVLNDKTIPNNAIKLNHFLTNDDYRTIEFALANGSIFKRIENVFSPKRFISHYNARNKNDVLMKLSSLSKELCDCEELYNSIANRENHGFTSYGNLIALPHPEFLLSEETFCCVAILENPIIWSENNKAQIIILCSASKKSGKDLQILFNFISLLFNDRRKIKSIIENQDYSHFVETLESLQRCE